MDNSSQVKTKWNFLVFDAIEEFYLYEKGKAESWQLSALGEQLKWLKKEVR
ncbi:hypothetical protein ACE1CI_20870 [Aerosakkonemataceae cyanobacterium BLCC-F50]|uniref:Uncharacterized protein n=1 Tax=Floridaenema flaviceps BLCC-F50 TaxID=3153642 RepID=A0ABV4XUH0_9CYAN